MKKLEIKNHKIILRETQQQYQHYLLVKLINMNIIQVAKYYLLIRVEL